MVQLFEGPVDGLNNPVSIVQNLKRKEITRYPRTLQSRINYKTKMRLIGGIPEPARVDPGEFTRELSRCEGLGCRDRHTPGAWKQQRSDTADVLVHDAVPVVEHPELVTARLNNSSAFHGEKNGVARVEPTSPARRVTASILDA